MRRGRFWALSGTAAAVVVTAAIVLSVIGAEAQRSRSGRRADEPALTVEEYTPRSTLVVDAHPVPRARYPVIDVHSHHRPASPLTAGAGSSTRWTGSTCRCSLI